ncbi:12903_t:CDS:2, partial [Entrophospora sp. SA101]
MEYKYDKSKIQISPKGLKLLVSDGPPNHNISTTPITDENGTIAYYRPILPNEGKEKLWLEKIGKGLETWLKIFGEFKNKIIGSKLIEFPAGYLLFEHIKIYKERDDRSDNYLFGGKYRFRSPNEFIPHAIYLASDGSVPCACIYCFKSQQEPTNKGLTTTKTNLSSENSINNIIDRNGCEKDNHANLTPHQQLEQQILYQKKCILKQKVQNYLIDFKGQPVKRKIDDPSPSNFSSVPETFSELIFTTYINNFDNWVQISNEELLENRRLLIYRPKEIVWVKKSSVLSENQIEALRKYNNLIDGWPAIVEYGANNNIIELKPLEIDIKTIKLGKENIRPWLSEDIKKIKSLCLHNKDFYYQKSEGKILFGKFMKALRHGYEMSNSYSLSSKIKKTNNNNTVNDHYKQIYWGNECIKINDLVRIGNDKRGSDLCIKITEIYKDNKDSIKFKGDLLMSIKDKDKHKHWIKFDFHKKKYIFDLDKIAGSDSDDNDEISLTKKKLDKRKNCDNDKDLPIKTKINKGKKPSSFKATDRPAAKKAKLEEHLDNTADFNPFSILSTKNSSPYYNISSSSNTSISASSTSTFYKISSSTSSEFTPSTKFTSQSTISTSTAIPSTSGPPTKTTNQYTTTSSSKPSVTSSSIIFKNRIIITPKVTTTPTNKITTTAPVAKSTSTVANYNSP